MKRLNVQANAEDENRLKDMPIFLRNRLLDEWQAERDTAEWAAEERRFWREQAEMDFYQGL
jgi:hypothetical protein